MSCGLRRDAVYHRGTFPPPISRITETSQRDAAFWYLRDNHGTRYVVNKPVTHHRPKDRDLSNRPKGSILEWCFSAEGLRSQSGYPHFLV